MIGFEEVGSSFRRRIRLFLVRVCSTLALYTRPKEPSPTISFIWRMVLKYYVWKIITLTYWWFFFANFHRLKNSWNIKWTNPKSCVRWNEEAIKIWRIFTQSTWNPNMKTILKIGSKKKMDSKCWGEVLWIVQKVSSWQTALSDMISTYCCIEWNDLPWYNAFSPWLTRFRHPRRPSNQRLSFVGRWFYSDGQKERMIKDMLEFQ